MSNAKPESFFTPVGANFIVNTLTFLTLAMLGITGLYIFTRFEDANVDTVGGFGHGQWTALHERLGILLLVMIAYHIFRHYSWIIGVIKGRSLKEYASRKRTWIALALAITLFVMFTIGTLHFG